MLKSNDKIGAEVTLFVRHIESLREALPLSMIFNQGAAKDSRRKLDEFITAHCEILEESESNKNLKIPFDMMPKWKRLKCRDERIHHALKLVPRSIFVSLVSQFDAFLGRLIKAILITRPDEYLNQSEKTLSYSEALAFDSIESILNHLVDKETEALLRKSHAEQFDWMEKRFGVELRKDLSVWPCFIELTERRNLFVHADGVVSAQYLAVCRKHGFALEDSVVEGSSLGVSAQYFKQAYNTLFELGVKLAQVLWRKLFPGSLELADQNLNDLAYDLLDSEEFDTAIIVLDFACETLKKYSMDWFRIAFAVNRAQAYKWSGNTDKAIKILDKYDWTALGDQFKLANYVLRENWEDALKTMKRLGSETPDLKLGYQEWPLFRDFRKRPDFQLTYSEVFSEAYPSTVTSPSKAETGSTLLTAGEAVTHDSEGKF